MSLFILIAINFCFGFFVLGNIKNLPEPIALLFCLLFALSSSYVYYFILS